MNGHAFYLAVSVSSYGVGTYPAPSPPPHRWYGASRIRCPNRRTRELSEVVSRAKMARLDAQPYKVEELLQLGTFARGFLPALGTLCRLVVGWRTSG